MQPNTLNNKFFMTIHIVKLILIDTRHVTGNNVLSFLEQVHLEEIVFVNELK
jgi:hypothetical protein